MRKNLRRLAVFGLTAAMGAALLTGCGEKSGGGGDPLTVEAKTAK